MPHLPSHNNETKIEGNPDYDGEMRERRWAEQEGMKITNCCHNLVDISYSGKCSFCEAPNV